MTNWVYKYSREHDLYTVGFYDPHGEWIPESDHTTSEAAAAQCHWLNGAADLALQDVKISLECWK